ncbi:MAG: hypothetical protein ACI39F_07760 [Acutalibacteraceae bacterium]
MKKSLSVILSLVILLGALSFSTISAGAESINNLTKYTYSSEKMSKTLSLTADSVVTVYTTTAVRDDGEFESIYLNIYDSSNIKKYDEYVYDSTGTVFEYKFYLPKGNYTVEFDMRYMSSYHSYYQYYRIDTAATTLYGSNNKLQNGSLINYTYLLKDNNTYLSLTEDTVVAVDFTLPFDSKGEAESCYLYVKNSSGFNVVSEDYSKYDGTVFSKRVLLPKGNYTVDIALSYSSDLNKNFVTNQYKITATSAKNYKVKTPVLTSSIKKNSSSYYTLTFTWADDADYDEIQLWTKSNSGKWTLYKTTENSTYYRAKGYNVYYYSGNFAYYKVRAVKKGINCNNIYSAFSNVVSMKKLDNPDIKVAKGKKSAKITVSKASSGASGYEIYRSTKKNKGFKKVKTVKGKTLTWTNKKLASKKTYYYKVRAYKTVGKDKMYSGFTAVKKVKTK